MQGLAAQGDITFEGPLSVGRIPGATHVSGGDLDHDGKLDLIVSVSHQQGITIFFQDSQDRESWDVVTPNAEPAAYFARAGDFDTDGIDDLVVADIGTTVYYMRSQGDRTFGEPVPTGVRGLHPRWIGVSDWNHDGNLDFSTADSASNTVSVVLGDGAGKFITAQVLDNLRPAHAVEATDHDGDGILDLVIGVAARGIQVFKGKGDGTFRHLGSVTNLGCVEYLSVGDFDGDGRGDLATACEDDYTAYAGLSREDGSYTRVFAEPFGTGFGFPAVGDIDGDGLEDLALVSQGSSVARVYPGKGDGSFKDHLEFGPIGASPGFLIAEDVDADGRKDVISADTELTVLHGVEGERFLRSANSITGLPGEAKAFDIADLDRDGAPDLFLASRTLPLVSVYLNVRGGSPRAPTYTIEVPHRLSSMAVEDLDGDRLPDIAGVNLEDDAVVVSLLGADGVPREAVTLLAGPIGASAVPEMIAVGPLDPGQWPDLVIAASGLDALSVFLVTGPGAFGEPRLVPTVERPKRVALADVDVDGSNDLLVTSRKSVVVHWGGGNGSLSEPQVLMEDAMKSFGEVAAADLDGDALPDVGVIEARSESVLLFRGRGGRSFEPPVMVPSGISAPSTLVIQDVDGDGFRDVTTSSPGSWSASIAWNLGGQGFTSEPVVYRGGVPPSVHRFEDMDLDGTPDLVFFGARGASIRLGRRVHEPSGSFRRGDVDGDRTVGINDAVHVLRSLFLGDTELSCADAGDADDSGVLDVTDGIRILRWLFLGDAEPPPPGPFNCGPDRSPDDLPACRPAC